MTELNTTIKNWWNKYRNAIYIALLAMILVAGASLRLVGINWDEDKLLHPDERFLLLVEGAIKPVENLSEYFNTDISSLNPHNHDYNLFVYGTFPIFAVRYLTQWVAEANAPPEVINPDVVFQPSLNDFKFLGRQLSAIVDLMVVALVYVVGARVYDKRVGIIAAFFSAFAVLQIQLSHFFAVDTFLNLFILLSVFMAVMIATHEPNQVEVVEPEEDEQADEKKPPEKKVFKIEYFLLFGLAFGLAMATKVNAFPVAGLLPLAVLIGLDRLSTKERREQSLKSISYLVAAGAVSFLVFRIFQPYAFAGPSFFNISLNPKWVANMQESLRFATGEVDWPPSTQWARRPIWFSFQNLSLWGLGLPMAVIAWTGFLWVGWRTFTGKWRKHSILWAWTAVYFIWQSLSFNPTMRYQIPIYPTLAIFAAWALVALWDWASKLEDPLAGLRKLARPAVILVAFVSMMGTMLWAFAFSQTYTVSISRVESSRWIFQNIPGPINLPIETEEGIFNQMVPFSYSRQITVADPYNASFVAKADGQLSSLVLNLPVFPLRFAVYDAERPTEPLHVSNFPYEYFVEAGLHSAIFKPADDLRLSAEKQYLFKIDLPLGANPQDLPTFELRYLQLSDQSEHTLTLLGFGSEAKGLVVTYEGSFTLPVEFQFLDILATFALDLEPQIINLTIATDPTLSTVLASASRQVEVALSPGQIMEPQIFELDKEIKLEEGVAYHFQILLNQEGSLPITLFGAATANETNWDDGLPNNLFGYDAYGGIYQRDLNFQVYWDDDDKKVERFINTLNNSEYIYISSSRQYASTTRIPERYPLTIEYYRNLIGCPEERSIEVCYTVAQTDTFEGNLGFALIKTFQTNPALGPFDINDQFSEEAFTVYDHPKVFIFQKSDDYDREAVAAIFNSVDISQVIRLAAVDAKGAPFSQATLKLSDQQVATQQAGGTWSELFNLDSLINSFQPLTVVIWYMSVSVLGLAVYPMVRAALPGLQDRGYPFSRAVGLLLLSYLSWVAGSIGIPFSRLTIGIIGFLLLALGGYLYYRNREKFKQEWIERRSYFVKLELVILAFFLFGLLIRLGNPDLWHAAFGGEKPMDFSYFNAVLKSTSFPPYDPWFAGGYINYYYFGFVYVGVLVKFLGIAPAIAYNLILPTLFSLMAIGAFSVTWNLFSHKRESKQDDDDEQHPAKRVSPWLVGIAGALAVAVLGNLGNLDMIFVGFQRLGSEGLFDEAAGFFTKFRWSLQGMVEVLGGATLPYRIGDWYWNPSRVIPNGPINEFPMFTVLYADLHAHLIALPLTLLAIGWTMSVAFSRGWENYREKFTQLKDWRARLPILLKIFWALAFGSLVVGALRPTNTWDFPTYLALGSVVLLYTMVRYFSNRKLDDTQKLNISGTSVLAALGSVALFLGLAFFLYQPYAQSYVQGYTQPEPWNGEITPLKSYFIHWGMFLFVLISWLAWETRQWMASSPLSSLRKLEGYRYLIYGLFAILIAVVFVLQTPLNYETLLGSESTTLQWISSFLNHGVQIAWFVLPLATWVAVLLIRPGLSDAKRFVLFMVGTGLFLTIMVEAVRIEGDIGRMNTVFKFYLQGWVLLAVSSAAAMGWIFTEIKQWTISWRGSWQLAMTFFVASTALFPIVATSSKIRDRMAEDAPNTLDGMAYMQYATYGIDDVNSEGGVTMDLSQDYYAIQWMQANVSGSPVIVEANLPPYRWAARFTIYTGLPSVLGWDWHQRQQREFVPGNDVNLRVQQIKTFYETSDKSIALEFLQTFNVKYIIFGQLERFTYREVGFPKFESLEGILWREVYRDQDTVIYEVIPEVLAAD